jgi:hypothetical protein
MVLGGALGVLIGVVTGFNFILLLRTAVRAKLGFGLFLSVAAHAAAMPTFWFGGNWLAGKVLQDARVTDWATSYAVVLAITFLLVVAYPLARFVLVVGHEAGRID